MTNISSDTIIGGIALILSIIGILYTRRSIRSPILLEARKKHGEELIEFLKDWYDKFPRYESAKDPKTTATPSASITYSDVPWHNFPKIETNWRYQDLIRYHLQNEYKTLPTRWEEYKKSTNEYGMMRYKLYEKIKNDVVSEVNLKYDPTWNSDQNHIISANVIESVYTQCVVWVKDGRLYADVTWDYNKQNTLNELWYDRGGFARGTEEERVQAKGVFEKMMFEESYLTKYRTDIFKIIEMEKRLDGMYKELKEMIDKLMGYSLLPGTECEILKNV